MKNRIILWLLIFALFGTSLWAVNQRNEWVNTAHYWYDISGQWPAEWTRHVRSDQESQQRNTDFIFALLCELYPDAKSVTAVMGKVEGQGVRLPSGESVGWTSAEMQYYFDSDYSDCDGAKDMEIRVY